jgi:hypothetical protein
MPGGTIAALAQIAEKFREACASQQITMWIEVHTCDPVGKVATLSGHAMHEGAHVLQMIGGATINEMDGVRRDLVFVLQSHRDDKAEFKRFRTLTAEGGSFLLSRKWLGRIGLVSFDVPEAIWLAFVLRFSSAQTVEGYRRFNQIYAQSVLAIDRAIETKAEKEKIAPATQPVLAPRIGKSLRMPPDAAIAAWRLRFSTGATQQKNN